jgi:hypothetical protein
MSRVGYRPGQPISNERLLIGGLSALAVATGSLMGAGAANADVYYKMGPLLGQSCDDPLKLANDPSAGEIVCTRYGQWVQSVNPTAVRSLGAPCPPSGVGSGSQNAR